MPVILRKPRTEAERLIGGVWSKIAGTLVIPVDPARIAKELGIDVFEAELDPSVSGAIIKKPNSDPTILLNRDDSTVRQRFSCAHELGHYVLHADDPEEYEYVDFRNDASSTGDVDEEMFANAFAANLLMPEDEVRRRSKDNMSAVEMAFEFRVSQESMTNRLKNLGLPVG